MKRIVLVSLLLLTASCTNKRNQEEGSAPSEPPSKPAASAAPKEAKEAPPQKAEEPKSLPAPADVAAPPANAEKSATGLAWTVLEPGSGGAKPGPTDKVQVHYTGWSADGKMFDSSEVRGEPTSFGLNQVIPGWTEGLQLMTVGEKRRFWIPAGLAYGETPQRPGAPSGQLTFDVKLLDILAAPAAPKDVAKPPASAKKTASGLAYVVLEEGTGPVPTLTSRVDAHYTGWTADGKMFDSSIPRGRPSTFGVGGVIKGWTEGLQLMKEGAKYRFWIPADLAYGDKPQRPGAPTGQLTFDVQLVKVN
jgi:FKBP-type peptidyl-prolyl cis-trans isomerase